MITVYAVYKTGLFSRTKGLIGENKASPIFLKTRFGLHTFGMKFAIDVVVLDENDTVVKIQKNLVPGRVFFWNPKWERILELPEGEIADKDIKTGERLKIIFTNYD